MIPEDANKRFSRRDAVRMDELVSDFVREMKLAAGLNRQLIYDAWDRVSGAAPVTISKYMKGRVLYCGISSSAVRQQLFFRRKSILDAINDLLREDPLFSEAGEAPYLKNIVLQ